MRHKLMEICLVEEQAEKCGMQLLYNWKCLFNLYITEMCEKNPHSNSLCSTGNEINQ